MAITILFFNILSKDILTQPSFLFEVALRGFENRKHYLQYLIIQVQEEIDCQEAVTDSRLQDPMPLQQPTEIRHQPCTGVSRPTFCKCRGCQEMPTDKERRCCGQRSCVEV